MNQNFVENSKQINRVVAIAGSASLPSSTGKLAQYILNCMPGSVETSIIHLASLSHTALLKGDMKNDDLRRAVEIIAAADGVIFATPIYKASLSGISKAFLDILPQYAFAGKTVWPVATGGSIAHTLALDYGVRPIIQSMGARQIIQSCFLTADQVKSNCEEGLAEKLSSDHRFQEAFFHFNRAVSIEPSAPLLGHPVPERSIPETLDTEYHD